MFVIWNKEKVAFFGLQKNKGEPTFEIKYLYKSYKPVEDCVLTLIYSYKFRYFITGSVMGNLEVWGLHDPFETTLIH
jgi:hypothetical protein